MATYQVRVIGGWCGNRLVMVAEHLAALFSEHHLPVRVTHQSLWDSNSLPPGIDVVLQLMPAFSEAEAGCPVLTIRPLVRDLDHEPTIQAILAFLNEHLAGCAVPDREVGQGFSTSPH